MHMINAAVNDTPEYQHEIPCDYSRAFASIRGLKQNSGTVNSHELTV